MIASPTLTWATVGRWTRRCIGWPLAAVGWCLFFIGGAAFTAALWISGEEP